MPQQIANVIDWHPSLWAKTCPAMPRNEALNGRHQADVGVVGAGFTGLRAALKLPEGGCSVIVLDAGDVGWGASGRTGGQVNPMLPFNSPKMLRALVGETYFERITAASLNSADELFALIDRYGIDCQARQKGWLRVLHNDRVRAKAEADLREWNAFGADMRLVDGAEVARLSGTTAYQSGVVAPRGGAVPPMRLALGMAEACKAAGVRIHGQSRVVGLSRSGAGWQVATEAGTVTSDWVILATNGYTDQLQPGLRRSIMPLSPIQIATEPLPASVIESLLPEGHTISDSRRVIMYARREPDNRMVYGGLGRKGRNGGLSGFDWLQKDAERVFPQLKGANWTSRWGGQIALTDDHLPHLHEPESGLLAGLGYNGRGVAMSNVMGRVMAARVLGTAPDALPFPTTDIKAVRFREAKLFGMGPAIGAMRFMDWLETR
jgi:sarcosine oxidase